MSLPYGSHTFINYFNAALVVLLISGCSASDKTENTSMDTRNGEYSRQPYSSHPDSENIKTNVNAKVATSHLSQCNRDLESLRTVDAGQYRRLQTQYDTLMKSSESFLTVKDDVSPEVAALARPRFQFALVNLCYRIKDALAQTLIRQAGGEG